MHQRLLESVEEITGSLVIQIGSRSRQTYAVTEFPNLKRVNGDEVAWEKTAACDLVGNYLCSLLVVTASSSIFSDRLVTFLLYFNTFVISYFNVFHS